MAGTAPTDFECTTTTDAGPVNCSVWLCAAPIAAAKRRKVRGVLRRDAKVLHHFYKCVLNHVSIGRLDGTEFANSGMPDAVNGINRPAPTGIRQIDPRIRVGETELFRKRSDCFDRRYFAIQLGKAHANAVKGRV